MNPFYGHLHHNLGALLTSLAPTLSSLFTIAKALRFPSWIKASTILSPISIPLSSSSVTATAARQVSLQHRRHQSPGLTAVPHVARHGYLRRQRRPHLLRRSFEFRVHQHEKQALFLGELQLDELQRIVAPNQHKPSHDRRRHIIRVHLHNGDGGNTGAVPERILAELIPRPGDLRNGDLAGRNVRINADGDEIADAIDGAARKSKPGPRLATVAGAKDLTEA
nr:homoserine kinase [Ipomoea batatas]